MVTVRNYSNTFTVELSELFIETIIQQSPVQIMVHKKSGEKLHLLCQKKT